MKIASFSKAAALLSIVLTFVVAMSPKSSGQAGPTPARSGAITPAQARRRVDEISRDLREARAAAGRISEKAIRERIERLLSQAELRARDLSDELARARSPQPQSPAPMPLPAADFEKLLRGLKKEAFDDGKLRFVQNFAAKGPLSCQQAAALLKCFAFDEGRTKAVKVLYPRLVDPQNFNDVLDVFVFPNSKAEARKAIGLK
jgi:hypothetical protein